jgi:hypothetical protein
LAIVTENESAPGSRPEQIEKDPYGRSLSRSVEAEESYYLALSDFEIELVDSGQFSIPLGQVAN